eukprot:1209133-Rhodomonas_salina.3
MAVMMMLHLFKLEAQADTLQVLLRLPARVRQVLSMRVTLPASDPTHQKSRFRDLGVLGLDLAAWAA